MAGATSLESSPQRRLSGLVDLLGIGANTALWPMGLGLLVIAILIASTTAAEGPWVERLQLLNRYLARTSFYVFILIFAASPLVRWFPAASPLIRLRRSLGLTYALIMGVHLAAILLFFAAPDAPELNISRAAGGAFGFLLIAALAFTSRDAAIRRLGRRAWKRLHAGSLYYLWLIYFLTYSGRVTERGAEYWPGLATVIALMVFRMSTQFFSVRKGQSLRA